MSRTATAFSHPQDEGFIRGFAGIGRFCWHTGDCAAETLYVPRATSAVHHTNLLQQNHRVTFAGTEQATFCWTGTIGGQRRDIISIARSMMNTPRLQYWPHRVGGWAIYHELQAWFGFSPLLFGAIAIQVKFLGFSRPYSDLPSNERNQVRCVACHLLAFRCFSLKGDGFVNHQERACQRWDKCRLTQKKKFHDHTRLQMRLFFKSCLFGGWKHTFSAFWLRSSVVSVLISLISDTRRTASPDD